MDALVTLYDALMWPLVRILIVVMAVIFAAVIGGIIHLALTRPRAHDDEYGAWGDTGTWRGNKPAPDDEEDGL